MVPCPSDEQLARLLDGQLDTPAEDGLVAHVEACPGCRERMEAMARGRPMTVGGRPVAEVAAVDPHATADPPADDPDGTIPYGPAPPLVEPAAGLALADYQILAKLGEGGMGVVYRARHQSLNRLVALKMIRPGGQEDPEQIARFLIEAEAVARLKHPNIVQIYDYGEAGGLPFCALELLEGGSLREKLARTAQPGKPAAALMVTLSRAMHAAHRAGIVHRDLKPGNVLFDADGTPKIADFGLAKRLEREDGHTRTGSPMGTPSYMAPEQALGENRQIGPRTDVYALGAILYELLTGRPPFKGPSADETRRQVIYEDPVPPSRLQPRVPRDLETICLKCLAKEPHRRYDSASDLADDLSRYLEGRTIRARRTPAWERALKWIRRHPAAATLLASAATLVVGLTVAWVRHKDRVLAQELDESRRFAALRSDAAVGLAQGEESLKQDDYPRGQSVVGRVLGTIEREPRLADLRARALDLRDRLDRGKQQADADQADRDRFERFVAKRFDALYHATRFNGLDPSENWQATRSAARSALGEFAQEGADDSWTLPDVPDVLMPEEQAIVAEGCYELLLVLAEAEAQPLPGEEPSRQAERALRILDAAAALPLGSSQAIHLRRAACLDRLGDAAGAGRERGLAAEREPASPFDHFLSGLERYVLGDGPGAMREFEAVLQPQPDHFWAQCLLAICLVNAQRPGEARGHLTACLRSRPDLPWLYLLRGFASGQAAAHLPPAEAAALFEVAEADYRLAAERLAEEAGGDLRYVLHVNRGVLRLQRRQWDEARADLQEAVRLNPDPFFPYDLLAQVDEQQGRPDDALARLSEAIERAPGRADLYRKRARLYSGRREIDPALRDLDEAIRLGVLGGPERARDRIERGRLLHGTGRLEEALAAYDAALETLPGDAEAHRLRVDALLKLKRYDDVIGSCDAYLASGPPSADLHVLRGLARVARKDYPGAIADYSQALALRPEAPRVLADRGWAYLVSGAPRPALRDFEEALRLDPSDADAYCGRGNARVLLGQHRDAVADALEALRLGEPSARTYYNAAHILALAAAVALTDGTRRGLSPVEVAGGYLDRAESLLFQAVETLPAAERAAFWQEVVLPDPALRVLRRRPRFAAFAGLQSRSVRSGVEE